MQNKSEGGSIHAHKTTVCNKYKKICMWKKKKKKERETHKMSIEKASKTKPPILPTFKSTTRLIFFFFKTRKQNYCS